MEGKFVFALCLLGVLIMVEPSLGCKICGIPWCSSEEIHNHHQHDCNKHHDDHRSIELSIIEPLAHHVPHHRLNVEKQKCHHCGGHKSHPRHTDWDHCHYCGGLKHHSHSPHPKLSAVGRKYECKCKSKNNHHHHHHHNHDC